MTEVVDVDAERGWLLMRDAGTRLRELGETPKDLHHWERLLPEYAQLQIEVAQYAHKLLALGVPEERLAVLPDLLRELLAVRPDAPAPSPARSPGTGWSLPASRGSSTKTI